LLSPPNHFLSPGGIGGYVLVPSLIGADACEAGAADSRRRAGVEHAGCGDGRRKADFQLEQMQRWNVNPSDLPAGSEIRFREPTFWERYRWQSIAIGTVILAQALLIAVLLHERRKRHDAEVESRHRMSELAHVSRQATTGELSSSLVHELKQPLDQFSPTPRTPS